MVCVTLGLLAAALAPTLKGVAIGLSTAATLTSAGVGAAQATGAFDPKNTIDLTKAEKEERSKRMAAAARGGRSSTVLTGGALSQSSSGSGGTALGGSA